MVRDLINGDIEVCGVMNRETWKTRTEPTLLMRDEGEEIEEDSL